MALGFGKNNKLASLGNFLVMFGVQFVFALDEALNVGGELPSPYAILKMGTSSAVVTLLFYGYNKVKNKEET